MKIKTSLLATAALMLIALSAGAQVQINSGGPAVSPFVADEDFTGGTAIDHANTIDTSKVTNPAPAAVYQTARNGSTTYTIPGFTAGTSYLVRLHFCETYFTSSGSRTFNVSINGTQVLTDFDIFATAGGQNIANIQQFTEPANSSGQFVIVFTSVVNLSLVSGIEVLSTGSCSVPTAPSGLTATATSSSQINLSWTASTSSCAVTYDVFRSTTSGFTPSSSNQITSGVSTTTYSDTGLAPSTTYYYLVEGTDSGGTSGPSNQANATTSASSCAAAPTAPSALTATAASSSQINLTWTASTAGTGCSITYNVFRSTTSGFTPSSSNQIASGVATASFSDTVLSCATIYYYLVEATDSAGTSAASSQASATTQSCSSATNLIQINAGGPTVSPFVADMDFTGGNTVDHANTINTSKVTNPAPAAVYQTARYGSFSYTIAGFAPGANSTIRLHFAETVYSSAGSREFNVNINGIQVLTDFDIYAAAGGQNIANIQQFTEPATADGQYLISFTSVVGNSLLAGIEISGPPECANGSFVLAATPASQSIVVGNNATFAVTPLNCGGFAGNVSYSLSGLPAGAASNFSPASADAPESTSAIITTSSSTPLGTSNITITGTSGTLASSVTVSLTVISHSANVTRAQGIVSAMSQADMVSQVHGTQDTDTYREVIGIPSEGIPNLNITNGPAGAAAGGPGHQGLAVALGAPLSLAATFDTAAAFTYGNMVGKECKYFGNGLVEGPDINMARVPFNGRTFEAYGEDPYLTSQIAVNDIQGIQSNGIIAQSKHYAANNQETNRSGVSADIDERTLREIYLPHFEAAVKQGGVGSFMCAYNAVNGVYNCENTYLLTTILRGDWGFTGFVMSDFGATSSTVNSPAAGQDLEMPGAVKFGAPLLTDLENGTVPVSEVQEMLVRRFSTMMDFGLWDTPPVNQCPDPSNCVVVSPMKDEDGATDRTISEEGMVLLQNTGGILPLNASQLHSIALIGPFATAATLGGGGSSTVNPVYQVAPQTGIQNRVGSGVTVTVNDGSTISTAVSLAQSSDVAIVMVGTNEMEGTDLTTLELPGTQDSLIEQVVAAQPKTIVVVHNGSPVLMPWVSSVPSILEAWYPGSEDGNAVAAVLFGDFNPSGKLPITFPVSDTQTAVNTPAQYPGVNNVATYSEGVFMGYRYYDQNNLTPLFPFGFGLSYTTFSFSNLSISPTTLPSFSTNPNQTVTVSFNVKNTGSVTGAEVAQLYVGIPSPSSSVPEPPKWLKGFQRISLTPGQTGTVQLTLNMRSFAYWDVNSESWLVAPGTYQILVGDSSRNILLQGSITIN